jgi:hypothetical protein
VDHLAGQDGRGRRPVARRVVGPAGHFFDQLGARVFDGVLQLDGPGDGDAVIDDLGDAVGLFQDDVAAWMGWEESEERG